MANSEDYVGRITSYHRGRPNFTATVAISGEAYAELINTAQVLPAAFDLDSAIGAQLDAVGEWVGRSRYIVTPIDNAWFSWDTDGLGWGQGVWRDPYASDTGLTRLDDDTYRLLLRAKIAANNWDGTVAGAAAALDIIFGGTATVLYIEDKQNMHMIMGMAGEIPNALVLSLFAGGYVPLKPGGVSVEYVVTSENATPIFGWGVAGGDGLPLAGWGEGSWAVSPEYALTHDLSA